MTSKNTRKGWLERDADPVARFINDIRYARVGLYRLKDGEDGWYEQSYDHVPRKELPPGAMRVDGRRKDYLVYDCEGVHFPKNGEVTAIDYYLYTVNTSIDKALASTNAPLKNVNLKKLMLGVVMVAVVAVYVAVVIL